MMQIQIFALVLSITLVFSQPAWAGFLTVKMYAITPDGVEKSIGRVAARDTDKGLQMFPELRGLSVGEHGFHLHEGNSCDAALNSEGISVAGLAAGGHWDPDGTGKHLGPYELGHRGDLSVLIVNSAGRTRTNVVAPRLSTDDLYGKTLIVHSGGDTYTDEPPLGGGGARIACGVVES